MPIPPAPERKPDKAEANAAVKRRLVAVEFNCLSRGMTFIAGSRAGYVNERYAATDSRQFQTARAGGARPTHIVELRPVARGDEFVKGRSQSPDESPRFHETNLFQDSFLGHPCNRLTLPAGSVCNRIRLAFCFGTRFVRRP